MAGGSLGEENALKQATPYLCDFMYKTFHDRGFEDEDIYYFAHSAAKDLNGDGFDDAIVDSTERTTQKVLDSIKDWATLQSTNGPLFLYLNDHGQTDAFQIAPYEILTPALLDAALQNFQEATSRTVVLMLEACHSGTFIDDLQAQNRVLITSSDADKSYLGPDGTDSFSQFFVAELYKGASLSAAYNTACSALQELGKPQSKQQPQLDKMPLDLGPLHVVSAAVSAPAVPAISQVQISEIYDPQADGPLIIQADISEAQEGEAWALIKPEDYTPPLLGTAFATPVLDFQKVVLTDEAGDGSFDQHYTGQTQELLENGHYELVVFARNKDRIVSKSGLHPLTVVNGLIGPEAAFVASPATYALPNETILFSDSSQDVDGGIASRLWEFGDAQDSTSDQAEPEFSYSEPGTYVVSLTVTDDDGVSDTASAMIQIMEEVSSDISGLANSTEPKQSITWVWASEENVSYRLAVNQNSTATFTNEPFNATNSTTLSGVEGSWYLHVQTLDAQNNSMSPVITVSALLDNTPIPPEDVSVSGLPEGSSKAGSATLSVGGPGITQYRYAIDAGDWEGPFAVNATATWDFSELADGIHTVFVDVCDQAGNWQAVANVFNSTWSKDTTPPDISGLVNSTEPAQSATWAWDSNENATFRYAVNENATWAFTDEPFNTTNSSGLSGMDGTWYLHVQAKDEAGNVSPVAHASVVMTPPSTTTTQTITSTTSQISETTTAAPPNTTTSSTTTSTLSTTTSAPVTTTTVAQQSQTYDIIPDQWNLIGISVALENAAIDAYLDWGMISKIAKWSKTGFGTAEGGGFDAFTTFEPGLGYFIKGGPTAYSFDVNGDEYNQLPELSNGWNLITLPVNLIATVSEFMSLFSDAGWEIDKLASWTGTGYGTADGGPFDAFSSFEAGEGYWVKVTATQPGMPTIP